MNVNNCSVSDKVGGFFLLTSVECIHMNKFVFFYIHTHQIIEKLCTIKHYGGKSMKVKLMKYKFAFFCFHDHKKK